MHGIANENFHVCRMPDRLSKLAHVNFAHLFTTLRHAQTAV